MGIIKKKDEPPVPTPEKIASIRVEAGMEELNERFDKISDRLDKIENIYQDFREFRKSMTKFSSQEYTSEQKEILRQIESNITYNMGEFVKRSQDIQDKVKTTLVDIEELYGEEPISNYKGASQLGYHMLKEIAVMFDTNEETQKVLAEQINNLKNVFKAVISKE